jgi:galactitol-specific phosphotransferase system IIC component
MEKFFKNSLYMGIATVTILVLVVLWIWDEKKNTKKDFYGLLKSSTPAV